MAKIETIKLFAKKNDETQEDQNSEKITIVTKVKFHPMDIDIQIEYQLHLLLVNVQSSFNEPVFYPNLDQGGIVFGPKEFGENFLGLCIFPLKAVKYSTTIAKSFTINRTNGFTSDSIKAFASLVPSIAQATKWSNSYLFDVILK